MKISVLIPVYNRRALIEGAVVSALNQNVEGLEVTVVDNCSDDGTWEFLQTIKDSRLRLLRNASNLGLFGNFNRCGELADGKYTLFLCSDDRLKSGFLAKAIALMEAHPDAVLLSSKGIAVDEAGKQRESIANHFPHGCYAGKSVAVAWFWAHYHYGENPLNYPSGVLLRTQTLRSCLPFRAELGAVADIDMFLRVLKHGDLIVTDYVSCLVMMHSEQEGQKERDAGNLIFQHRALIESFRDELLAAGVYRQVSRQASSMVLAALIRTLRIDCRRAFTLFNNLRPAPMELLLAGSRRVMFTMAKRILKLQHEPYLLLADVRHITLEKS